MLFLYTLLTIALLVHNILFSQLSNTNPSQRTDALTHSRFSQTATNQFSHLNTILSAFFFSGIALAPFSGLDMPFSAFCSVSRVPLKQTQALFPSLYTEHSLIQCRVADHSIYLNDILSDHTSDLVALSETWFSVNKHTPSELILLTQPGYELLSCPCKSGTGDGNRYLTCTTPILALPSNRIAICFRSKVISTSGFHFRFRYRHLSYRCRPMSDKVGSVIVGVGHGRKMWG